MKPEISEFSYGFALTNELINWHGLPLTAAPVFPSLYQEGQPGGGYDVMLQRPGIPLFLQFKLSRCMTGRTTQEVKNYIFHPPFYRMPILPKPRSKQHQMLLDLENAGNEVYYVAPAFHTLGDLNCAYVVRQVALRSLWLRPSFIGPLPDDKSHHVAFSDWHKVSNSDFKPHFCSTPRPLETRGDFKEFENSIERSFRKNSETALKRDALEETANYLSEIVVRPHHISNKSMRALQTQLVDRHPLYKIAVYSHMFLDSHLFVVMNREESERQQEAT